MPLYRHPARWPLATAGAALLCTALPAQAQQMQVGFLWHMHQPIYYPGETITQTQAAGHFSFSIYDVHNQRFGPYTTWPKDAISTGSFLPNLGASVSFSGSLIENLNNMKNAGVNGGMWNNWNSAYTQARQMTTVEGNARLDMIGFNYNHALMPLLDERDMRMQIKMHKVQVQQTFGSSVPYSTGFFPAETAFSERMIPALVAEGFQWSLVDNIHFDRATKNYPQNNASGLFAPNKADQINPDPAANGGAWVQLNNVWAPSKVSAPFSYRPHNVEYVNPNSGAVSKIVAVPGARYEGNEDGRGGFGALQYQQVMDQVRPYNTDPAHPMLVMLHHDGDNYGGGSDSYYHSNFQNMVNWANGNANYNVTTVSDYLEKYPVAASDVIHVENGAWAGADNGDAEFKKWLGDPNASGWSPDRNSWAVLTAAKNRVFHAEDIAGPANPTNVINNTGTNAEKAWHYLAQAEASDHWYWDGTQVWDSNVTRGSNLAVAKADLVINANPTVDNTAPSVFVPQRDSYNPGAYEFGSTPEPSDFKVWTYAYDVSGLTNVTLKYRTDIDGENPLASIQNETFTGGAEVSAWTSLAMASSDVSPPGNILSPTYRALQYAAMIQGQSNKLLDYYIEAVDSKGNVTKSDIQHVWVGGSTTPPPPTGGQFVMDGALDADAKEIASKNGMHLYYSMHGGKLYVATNDAGEGNDHFIYLAGAPGAMVNANWAKAGQIAQWAAYLADENSNDFEQWFDAQGASLAATGANGGVLEGTLDLAGEFGGTIPLDIYLAVGLYGNADGGALLATHQLPGTLDNDGNIQANEYLKLTLPIGWALGGGGDWNTAWNWCANIPNAVGANAMFLNVVATPSTVTTSTNVTAGHITFDSPYGYTLGGSGAITLDVASGVASINVLSGLQQIALPMTINDNTSVNVAPSAMLHIGALLTLANGSTMTTSGLVEISGAVTSSNGARVRVNGGLLSVNSDLNGAALQVDAGEAWLNSDQHLASVTIAAGAKATMSDQPVAHVARAATLAISGQLDLTDNALIVTGMSRSAVEVLVKSGFGNFDWQGTGITSSSAATFAQSDGSRAVGVIDNANWGYQTFSGQSVALTDVLVKYTWTGDANVDGLVDNDDFGQFLYGFNGGGGATWLNGDFDFSGVVDNDDFGALLVGMNAFNASGGMQLSEDFKSQLADFASANGLPLVLPEPSLLAPVAAIAGMIRRRRPKSA